MQVWTDEVQRPAAQRQQGGLRQSPEQSGRCQAECGQSGDSEGLIGRNVARQHTADAMLERITGGENTHQAPTVRKYFRDRWMQGAAPGACGAANERGGERQV